MSFVGGFTANVLVLKQNWLLECSARQKKKKENEIPYFICSQVPAKMSFTFVFCEKMTINTFTRTLATIEFFFSS